MKSASNGVLRRRLVGIASALIPLLPTLALLVALYIVPVHAAGLEDLASKVSGYTSGAKGLALGLGATNLVTGVLLKGIPGLSRRMREMGLEIIENGLIVTGIVASGAGLLMLAADIGSSLGQGGGVTPENPWK